jgi:class 3 adenylate cyclase
VIRQEFGEYAERLTLIRFDARGTGLSDRVQPKALDDWVRDIEAVVEKVASEAMAVAGVQVGTPSAIAFAARHPECVSRLVLINGFARMSDFLNTPQIQALLTAAPLDWIMATEATGFTAFGSGRRESVDFGAHIRSCVGAEYFENADVTKTWDVGELAQTITAPTLILKHEGVQFVTMEMVRDLASRIPNSQLAMMNGAWANDPVGMARRVLDFLNPGNHHTPAAPDLPSGMTAILFADIVDSTALTERLGDKAFRAKARDLDATLRTVISHNAGTAIEGKLLGDGVLAVFTSARQAIEAALACGRAGDEAALLLHLGLHAGDVIREENNVYGGAVNIASRISGLAAPGEVLVSDTVRSLARTSAGVRFEDRGEQTLKGVGEPVRVWAVREEA